MHYKNESGAHLTMGSNQCVAKVSNISGYTKRIMRKIHKKEEALHRWCEAPLVFNGTAQ